MRLRGCEPRDGHAQRRARDVVKLRPVEEVNRRRLAPVLAAHADLEIGARQPARARRREHELADALIALPRLKAVDASTYADLARERDALRMQVQILGHVRH